MTPLPMLDRIAAHLGIWALGRLFGANCETDIKDDFPGEGLVCLGCDAKRLSGTMRELLK